MNVSPFFIARWPETERHGSSMSAGKYAEWNMGGSLGLACVQSLHRAAVIVRTMRGRPPRGCAGAAAVFVGHWNTLQLSAE